ncbi:MAG: protein of unknown function transrane [Myxococcaceae bacterium]|nr:protein of unknown function transrane [Myxococcaceae bacterium]
MGKGRTLINCAPAAASFLGRMSGGLPAGGMIRRMKRFRRAVRHHREAHKSDRAAWLRAAVLGSDDAIVSTSSLMIGVAASAASTQAILIAGAAGLVAGSMSMAVGEYVSVSSQRDAEQADVEREKGELASAPEAELRELVAIYEKRGLTRQLATEVAAQLSARDRLGTHLRDELGIDPHALSRPFQAAWISALSFGVFALVPILALGVSPVGLQIPAMALASLLSLGSLGAFGAHLGGASRLRGALRVTIGGLLAMAVTAGIGKALGVTVG